MATDGKTFSGQRHRMLLRNFATSAASELASNAPRNSSLAALMRQLTIAAILGLSTAARIATASPLYTFEGFSNESAQSANWLSDNSAAIGRCDGTIAVFEVTRNNRLSIKQILVAPAHRVISAIQRLSTREFLTSDDEDTIMLWRKERNVYVPDARIRYPTWLGSVTSSTIWKNPDRSERLALGHHNGYVTFWTIYPNGKIDTSPFKTVDVALPESRSKRKSVTVTALQNYKRSSLVATTDDGGLTVLENSSQTILSQKRYNENAGYGINDIAILDNQVLLTNCEDSHNRTNLSLYRLDGSKITKLSATELNNGSGGRLKFSFSVVATALGKEKVFLATTEDGNIWQGRIGDSGFMDVEHQHFGSAGAPVLAISPDGTRVIASSQNTVLLKLTR